MTRSGRSPRLVDDSAPVAQTGLDSVVADSSTQLTLTANASFGGNSAFLIQVADGDASDSGTLTASLSLPVRIKATQNQPPTFAPTAIRVEAGGAAVTQDLRLGVRDPEGTDVSTFTYVMGSAPDTVSASLSGTVLTVSAPETTPAGSAGAIAVSVTDEQGNTVNGSIPVEVVATTKPRIQLPAYNVKAKAGETVSVDVASNATNPFPDTPITLEGTAISLGDATTSTSGTVVTITPKSAGTISVAYRVNDKLKDPSRVVQGTITVVVEGKPGVPTNVRAQAVSGSSARITFDAPEKNGSPITGYLVYDNSGRQVGSCTGTACIVSDLRDGQTYAYRVSAVNANGESDKSALSNSVTIASVPGQPLDVKGKASETTIDVQWVAPSDNGSQITGYTVTATVAGGRPATVDVSGKTSATLTGLVPGKNYTITVVAHNAKGSSPASKPISVSTKAEAPDTPSITRGKVRNALDGRLEITLTWNYFKSGGTGWGSTTVTVNGNTKTVSGGVNNEMNGTGTTSMIVDSADEVTATVTVSNVEGRTATSASRTFPPILKPPTPDAPGLHAPGDNSSGQIQVSNARLREGNGYKAADLELFYGDTPEKCKAPGNPVHFDNSDQADFIIGPLDPGSTVTYYFCQRGKKNGSYVWSETAAVTGVVGTGQRSRDDDDNSPIPTFEVQAAASYVQKNRSWGVAASWSNPSGVEITQTNTWIEGLKDSTKQSWSGPLNNWWAEDLAPGHEYTIVVELIGKKGQHREVKTTVKTGDLADNVKATFEGAVTCPNGQPCGSMTLRAVNAPNYSSGVILVCRVKTGRPSAITEFRFSRDNPQITGILTEATTGEELLAKPPVVDCRAE